jgi:hypothetical protein
MRQFSLLASLLVASCAADHADSLPQDGKGDTAQDVTLKAKGRLQITFRNVKEDVVRIRALAAETLAIRAFHDTACGEQGTTASEQIAARFPTLDVDTPASRTFCLVVENPSSRSVTFELQVSDAARAGTTESCQLALDQAVMEQALELSETARLRDQRVVHGSTSGDLVIVSVSDETEPTHYVAITNRRDPKVCEAQFVSMINEGLLPDLNELEAAAPTDSCKERIEAAVLAEAGESIVGMDPIYGGEPNGSFSSIVVVRTEQADYAVVTETETCAIENVSEL